LSVFEATHTSPQGQQGHHLANRKDDKDEADRDQESSEILAHHFRPASPIWRTPARLYPWRGRTLPDRHQPGGGHQANYLYGKEVAAEIADYARRHQALNFRQRILRVGFDLLCGFLPM